MEFKDSRFSSLLALSAVLGATLGCARHHPHHSDPPPPSPVPFQVIHHPTNCAIEEATFQARSNLASNDSVDVAIERRFQNVIHQDCHGHFLSSGIETVHSPQVNLDFTPNQRVGHVGAVWLFNDTACDWTRIDFRADLDFFSRWVGNKIDREFDGSTGNSSGALHLILDASKGFTTVHVNPGPNLIYYTYFDHCVPSSATSSTILHSAGCEANREVSSGSFVVNVHYSETTLPGDQIEKPTKCE